MHPLMPSILLGMARLDTFDLDADRDNARFKVRPPARRALAAE
jgi:hypothetical protein